MKKNIIITGCTGSLGKRYIINSLKNGSYGKYYLISRDEAKQFYFKEQLKSIFGEKIINKLNFILADIYSDIELINDKISNLKIDFLLHTAAQKQIESAENNPLKALQSNILGLYNISTLVEKNNIKNFIHLSTDKAVNPINTYGATKFIGDKILFSYFENKRTKFSIIRYGNVFGSKGSIVPFFNKLKNQKKSLPITNPLCTRFIITFDQAIKLINYIFKNQVGGEIFIPKLKSFKIYNLARLISNRIHFIKLRAYEKIHEELLSTNENNLNFFYKNNIFVLTKKKKYKKFKRILPINLNSETSKNMSNTELLKLLKKNNIEY
jgi:UDP-N-acetylglucosamine 4,6-dehydratase